MDITQLDQELRSGKVRPCYLVTGPEAYLAQSAKNQIQKTIFKGSGEVPDRFQARLVSLHAILDCLKTPSLLALWRLVFVEGVDRFKKTDWAELKKFLENPPEKATLVLIAEDLRAGDLKNLSSSCTVVECKKLYPRQVPAWINMEARTLGVSISQEAARFLAECVGEDLGSLRQALEKLLLFVGRQKLIQLEDVEKGVAHTSQKSVFDLTHAMGEKKPKEALKLLGDILMQGEEPLKTFALVARHFRLLARAQELLRQSNGTVGADFAKALKVHPFFAKDYAAQARHFDSKSWKKRFGMLFACDRALKSSRLKPQLVLEKWIWELCK